MLPILVGAAVFGLATQMPDQSYEGLGGENYGSEYRDIDDLTIGRLRSENIRVGKNFLTENSRIIRPAFGRKLPSQSAKEWTAYHRAHNKALKDLYAKDVITDNMRILRADSSQMKRIPSLPHPGGQFSNWKNIPNVFFDYDTPPNGDFRLDNDARLYDDKAGNAGGMPIYGENFVWNPAEWYGNPWGPSGQLYHQLRTKSNYPSAYGDPPERLKNNKKVSFGGVSIF